MKAKLPKEVMRGKRAYSWISCTSGYKSIPKKATYRWWKTGGVSRATPKQAMEALQKAFKECVAKGEGMYYYLKVPVPEPMKKHLETIQKDYNALAKDRSKYAKRRKV